MTVATLDTRIGSIDWLEQRAYQAIHAYVTFRRLLGAAEAASLAAALEDQLDYATRIAERIDPLGWSR